MADGYEDGAVTPPQLYRGISTIMNFSMALTAVNCVSSLITVFALGLTTGGPVVMVWGWIVVAVGFSLVGVSLAEICSAYPAAGGVYHWTAQLAPSKWAPAASYSCGWANYLAGTGATATFACSFASLVSALTAAVRAPPGAFDLAPGAPGLAMPTPPLPPADYTGFSPGAEVALAIATTAVWGLINALRVDQQGWVNNFAAGWQIASTAVIAAVVLGAAPELSSPTFVFTEFYNGTGWASVPYVVLIGLLYALFAFTGFDAGCQLAEETQDPSRAAPLGMIGCCLCTAVLGLILTVSLLFGTVDVAALLNNPYVGVDAANQPVVALFYYVGGRAGGPILVVLMVVNLFMAGVSTVTATSRMVFALARDDGLPGSSYLRWLHPTTGTPLLAVLLIIGVDAVILLLTLSSTSAIYNVSSTTLALGATAPSSPG